MTTQKDKHRKPVRRSVEEEVHRAHIAELIATGAQVERLPSPHLHRQKQGPADIVGLLMAVLGDGGRQRLGIAQLYWFEHLTAPQIAERLGLTESAVESAIKRLKGAKMPYLFAKNRETPMSEVMTTPNPAQVKQTAEQRRVLRDLRQGLGLAPSDVAHSTDIPELKLDRWETGTMELTAEEFSRLEGFLTDEYAELKLQQRKGQRKTAKLAQLGKPVQDLAPLSRTDRAVMAVARQLSDLEVRGGLTPEVAAVAEARILETLVDILDRAPSTDELVGELWARLTELEGHIALLEHTLGDTPLKLRQNAREEDSA